MAELKALLSQLVPAQAAASPSPVTALTMASALPASLASATAPAAVATPPVGYRPHNDDGWLAVKAQADSIWYKEQLSALKLERDMLLLQQAYQAGQRSRS